MPKPIKEHRLHNAKNRQQEMKRLIAESGFIECECVAESRARVLPELQRRFPYVNWSAAAHKVGGPNEKCKVCEGKGARHPRLDKAALKKLGVNV